MADGFGSHVASHHLQHRPSQFGVDVGDRVARHDHFEVTHVDHVDGRRGSR